MNNGIAIIKRISDREKLKAQKQRPSQQQFFEAAFQTPQVNEAVKKKLKLVQDQLNLSNAAREKIQKAQKEVLDSVINKISDAPHLREILRRLHTLKQAKDITAHPELFIGIDKATEILRAGATTIYSPVHPFYQFLEFKDIKAEKDVDPHKIVKGDAVGAVGGAVTGCIAGAVSAAGAGCLPGAAVGALAGAVGGSVTAALGELWDAYMPE
jgi:hypothetical protein